jgi:acyl-coenzyme A thioesterase PaaI-like protein
MRGNTRLKVLGGGVAASVLDCIAGTAVFLKMVEVDPHGDLVTELRMLAGLATIDLRIDYLEPAYAAAFEASATVTRLATGATTFAVGFHV